MLNLAVGVGHQARHELGAAQHSAWDTGLRLKKWVLNQLELTMVWTKLPDHAIEVALSLIGSSGSPTHSCGPEMCMRI